MAEAARARRTKGTGVPELARQALRFERRAAERTRIPGQGMATFIDPDGRLWLARISLLDRSGEGLGIRCPVPVAAGASCSLTLGGAPVCAVVAHSRASGGAYRLGLRLALRAAA